MTLELDTETQKYEALEQRRDALRSEINAIYAQYEAHIASPLRESGGEAGFLDFDALPSDEEYAAYDLNNTPLSALESQLFQVTCAMQDLRLTAV